MKAGDRATLKMNQTIVTGVTFSAGTVVEVVRVFETTQQGKRANVVTADGRRISSIPIERLKLIK